MRVRQVVLLDAGRLAVLLDAGRFNNIFGVLLEAAFDTELILVMEGESKPLLLGPNRGEFATDDGRD